MNNPAAPPPPKTRADCVLDATLSPADADAFADRLERGLSLQEAVRFLAQEHGVTTSESSVSRWAAKRRRARVEMTFACLREQIELDQEQAFDLSEDGAPLNQMYQANVLLANRALFAAQRSGDQRRVAEAARIFSSVLGTVVKARKVEIADQSALHKQVIQAEIDALREVLAERRIQMQETVLAHKEARFGFDVEKTSLDHVDALKKINLMENIRQRERIAHAIPVIFGDRPSDQPDQPDQPEPGAKPGVGVAAGPDGAVQPASGATAPDGPETPRSEDFAGGDRRFCK